MQLRLTRPEVYKLIDGERDYQDKRWGVSPGSTQGWHSAQEWLSFLQDYANEGLHVGTRGGDEEAYQKQLSIIRKIAGIATAAMEQHGAPPRETEGWKS